MLIANLSRTLFLSLSVVFVLLVIAVILGWLLNNGIIWLAHPDTTRYPVRGIDVSHHQNSIDWDKLGKQNIKFAYIKATEGGDFKDPNFQENWGKSREIGILRGGYHFFTLKTPGEYQAENFIRTVPNETDALPPAVDLEFGGNSKIRPEKEEFLEQLRIFLERLIQYYGKRPLLYVTGEFYEHYLLNNDLIKDYPLWTRNLFFEPSSLDGWNWLFWQYHSRGRIKGIKGFVDLNVFRYSEEALQALAISRHSLIFSSSAAALR